MIKPQMAIKGVSKLKCKSHQRLNHVSVPHAFSVNIAQQHQRQMHI